MTNAPQSLWPDLPRTLALVVPAGWLLFLAWATGDWLLKHLFAF